MLLHFKRCGHCKALQPEWERASKVLEDNRQFILGRVNCDATGKTLCRKANVEIYPDVRLYRHGKFIETYNGERRAGNLTIIFVILYDRYLVSGVVILYSNV